MALDPGTRFGPYEVTGQIGAGGMGEVYRATDTKLGRDVAIKTLPSAVATDADRLARFEREAKLLAALNHAHIASIYGLDEHDGTQYLAMELVEGETLEEKLKNGPLPVDEALRLALQIAAALEAAHEKGVVHRDLKPANVMITPQGEVKVLDFGLAKAFSGDPTEATAAHSPALSLAMTQAGIVLGTAGYMSPEQASGQATDQRADVWGFGVVLYEMLTGLPLFTGESVPHILAAVLQIEPDWNQLPKGLHPRLKQMLQRCLTKKPRNRLHAVADARIEIETALTEPEAAMPQAAALGAPPSMFRRVANPIGMLAVGAAIAGVAAWIIWPRPLPLEPQPVNRFDYDVPEEMVFRSAGRPVVALSRDGRHFVFNTEDGIFLRRMRELDARLIPGTEEDMANPFLSHDGQSVAYVANDELKRISISGGAPFIIASDIDNLWGASWEADGMMLVGQQAGIVQVSANGGTPELVFPAQDGERLYGPQLLSDGDSVLFSATQTNSWDTAEIVVGSLATGERSVVYRGGSDARYLPSGHLVYAFEDDLWGVAFDVDTLTVSGGPVPLIQGLSRAPFNTAAANYGIADDGTLIYLTRAYGGAAGGRTLVWVDRTGNATAVTTLPACNCREVALSPDGTRIAVTEIDFDRQDRDLWIWSIEAETRTRLTFGDNNEVRPVWTPDGLRIVYFSQGEGIVARAADGTGTVEHLLDEASAFAAPFGLDADDNVVLALNGQDVHVLDVEAGESRPLLAGEFNEENPALSPDGAWLAYASNETGMSEIYVRPYPDVDSGRWQVSEGGGNNPRWSADGSRLYYFSRTNFMEAEVETDPTFRRQTPAVLFSRDGLSANYDVSADGERFLMERFGVEAQIENVPQAQVIIVENWIEEVKRLIPVNQIAD